MDFLTGQRILYTSKRYKTIYDYFRENYQIKTHELFLLCMVIGFHHNKKIKRADEGSQFRTNFFSSKQRSAVYSMIISDPELGKNVEKFENNDFQLEIVKLMENYAEAGMTLLTEEVFLQNWDGNQLDDTYKEYEVDILSYIYNLTDDTPF